MYQSLGVKLATSILGLIGIALAPVPLIFYTYGARIRAMSKYVPSL